ncbi:MAG: hypothetical protein Q8Q56_01640, partial [Alphaproteobacteria bacterium]|nr:hypothetical protein [Alphaproteobacteria bacterium]
RFRPLSVATKARHGSKGGSFGSKTLGRRMQKRPPTKVGGLFAILAISIHIIFELSSKKVLKGRFLSAVLI